MLIHSTICLAYIALLPGRTCLDTESSMLLCFVIWLAFLHVCQFSYATPLASNLLFLSSEMCILNHFALCRIVELIQPGTKFHNTGKFMRKTQDLLVYLAQFDAGYSIRHES